MKKMKRIMAVMFGLTLLCGSVSVTSAHADEAEPCDVHTYSYDCDTTCNICGYERAASHTYNLYGQNYYYHWLKCECGAKLDIMAHDFDNDADLTCDECGYERHLEHDYSVPGADSTHHWDECSCGEKKNKEEHLLVQKTDGTWHWDECVECNTKVNIGAHVWGAGATEGDVTTYTCSICGTQRTVTTGPSGEGGNGTGEENGGNTGEDGQGSAGNQGDNTGDNTNPGGNEGTNTPGGNTGEGNQGSGDNESNNTGNNNGNDDNSGDNDGDDDSKEKKGGFGKWLFIGIGTVVVLWGGAIAGYLIYQKKKGSDKDSVKESKEEV